MPIEMTANELMDFRLTCGVQVLKFVHRLELDDIQTIGQDAIWLAFQQVLAFIRRDVRDGGEHVGAMCSGAFDAVAVIDTAFAGLMVDIEVLQIVVEID